ncbi:hypothetical protein BT96DRAFT_482438 [Gymnopus androsaceus JB14]|uniref:Uncharacterized protein n=1 Tax=Gymnopus androsaceus JB14 TaxID=1447944 RepID=A0A6A4HYT1_9AGAR|nr:hypothetical protein BT96DRAFT_482438 [Gymnopus androsaceus JB14]
MSSLLAANNNNGPRGHISWVFLSLHRSGAGAGPHSLLKSSCFDPSPLVALLIDAAVSKTRQPLKCKTMKNSNIGFSKW